MLTHWVATQISFVRGFKIALLKLTQPAWFHNVGRAAGKAFLANVRSACVPFVGALPSTSLVSASLSHCKALQITLRYFPWERTDDECYREGGGPGDGKETGGEETGAVSGQHAQTTERRETCERAVAAFDTRTPRPNLVVLNRACSDGGLHDQFTPKVEEIT